MLKINIFRNYERHKTIFVFFLVTIFFMLSVKYKQDNFPSVKPLYQLGLLTIGILCMVNIIKNVISNKINLTPFNQLPIYLLAALIITFGISSLLAPGREIKDFLYFLYWISVLPLFLITYINNKYDVSELLFLVCKAAVFFSILSSLVAILTFFGVAEFEYGSYVLRQNLWTINRIHGYMGEPTALGGLLGFSLIAFSYITETKNIKSKLIIFSFFIICIIGTGSRNTIVSLSFAWLFIILMNLKMSSINRGLILLIVSTIIFLVLLKTQNELPINILYREVEFINDDRNRLYIWKNVIDMFNNGSIINFLFGYGAGTLNDQTGGVAAFNASLEILYAHGIFGFTIYQMLFFTSLYIGLKRFKMTKSLVYKYGLMFLVFGYSFSLFMSFFPTTDFHFAPFSFIFGIMLVCIPSRNIAHS